MTVIRCGLFVPEIETSSVRFGNFQNPKKAFIASDGFFLTADIDVLATQISQDDTHVIRD